MATHHDPLSSNANAAFEIKELVDDVEYDNDIEDTFSLESAPISELGAENTQAASSLLKAQKRSKLLALLVVVVGSVAASIFLYAGITNERDSKALNFDRRATDLTQGLQSAMRDYERSCSWIHESTRNWRNDTNPRQRFRELYNYITNGGLDFFSMQW